MKTKIGLMLAVLGMLLQSMNADITTGLVTHYPFNGNANDESGNSNNGTVNGATLAIDRNGKANSAYHFNGVSDHITINPSTTLSLGASGFTLSAWVNAEKVYDTDPENDQLQVIVADGYPNLREFSYFMGYNQKNLQFSFAGSSSYPNNTLMQSAKFYKTFEVNKYYHIVTVYDGDKVYGYVNGELVSSKDVDNSIKPYALTDYVVIGMSSAVAEHGYPRSTTDYWVEFQGIIDDVRIYNRGLTASDVKALYDSEKPNSGLVAYYPFNGNANDESGNDNNGTTDGNYQFVTNGLRGNGLSIVGTTTEGYAGGGHVILPQNNLNSLVSDSFTLSIWANNDICSIASEAYISLGTEGSSQFWSRIELWSDKTIRFQIAKTGEPSTSLSTEVMSDSFFQNWKHLVLVKTTTTLYAYVNGVKIGEIASPASLFPVDRAAIGRHWWWNGSGSSARMTAILDNARIYSRALTASDVKDLYDSEKPVVNYIWPTSWTKTCEKGDGQLQYAGDKFSTWSNWSTDGTNWSTVTLPPYHSWLCNMGYGAGSWIMTGPQGQIFTSTDLTNWTKRTTPDTDDITEISYGNSVFVLRKYWQAGNMLRSADGGVTWATVSTGSVPGDARNYQEIEFGNGTFVYALDNSVRISTDGTTWTEHSVTVSSGFKFTNGKIHFDGVRFVSSAETAVNGNERTMTTGTSTDGITWTFKSSNVISPRQLGLGTVTDKLIVIASSDVSGTNLFISTDDGGSWIDYSTPWLAKNVYGWAFGTGVVVVATSDGLYKGVPQSPQITDVNLNMVVSPTEGGTTEPAVGTSIVKKDEAFTITATPASGYSFVQWSASPSANASIADSSSTTTTVTLTGDATVTAEVVQLYDITNLIMAVSPANSGTTDPAIGTKIVKKNEAFTIIASPASSYSFVRWTATPSSNVSIANPSSPTTTVTLTGDATVKATFSSTGDSGSLANSKVRIILDNSKQYKDSISIVKGKLPTGFVKPVEGNPLNIQVDAWTLDVNGGYKASGDKITYKGETLANGIKTNKYQLVLDLKKLEWNLRIANADLSTGSPLDSFDGLDIMLSVNGTHIGQNIGTDDLIKWRFTSTKNSSEKLTLGGEEWLNFAVNKADGSTIGDKPSKDSFTVGNGTGDIITFDSTVDSVTVLIDKFKVALNDADEGSGWKSGNGRHIFKGTFAGVAVVQFVLDLSKESASWKFKVSKADFWDDVDGSDGLDFRVIIGSYQGGLKLHADQTTTMSYPQK